MSLFPCSLSSMRANTMPHSCQQPNAHTVPGTSHYPTGSQGWSEWVSPRGRQSRRDYYQIQMRELRFRVLGNGLYTVELEPTLAALIQFLSILPCCLQKEAGPTFFYFVRARNRFQIVRLPGHTLAVPSAKLLSKFPFLLFTNLPLSLFLKLTFLSSCYSGILPLPHLHSRNGQLLPDNSQSAISQHS